MKTAQTSSERAHGDFQKFKFHFSTLCLSHGGVFSSADSLGDGAAFRIPTAFGTLRASIHFDGWKNRRNGSRIESIYLQWRDYSGPAEFPLHGEFNRFSHKWNITYSAGTLGSAREAALNEFRIRLELLAEEFPLAKQAVSKVITVADLYRDLVAAVNNGNLFAAQQCAALIYA